jgi:hypothetical protein
MLFLKNCRSWKNRLFIYLFIYPFGQSLKKIKMVKIGYFCMGQRMMWDNVVNLSSHIFCQHVQLCKLYN